MDIQDVIEYLSHLDPEETTSIDLSNKDIDQIPPEIGDFVYLEYLNLGYNNLTELPDEICEMKELKTLLLLRNNLRKLPEKLYELQELTMLDISYNPIIELPHKIELLTNLKSLDASYCKISKLPLEFTKLLSLKDVHLEENPFEFPPSKVIRRGLYATMYYLTEEIKKQNASRIMLQVFNMPSNIQAQFESFVSIFDQVVSVEGKHSFSFETNFLNPDSETDFRVDDEVQNRLYDVLSFLHGNLEAILKGESENFKIHQADSRAFEIKNDINRLNASLTAKIESLQHLQAKMENFVKLL